MKVKLEVEFEDLEAVWKVEVEECVVDPGEEIQVHYQENL